MPDRLDLPTPLNGGLIIVAVVVVLIVWAAVTVARAPYVCEVCGRTSPDADAVTAHEMAVHADDLCTCRHARRRHAHACVARGCTCHHFTERTPS